MDSEPLEYEIRDQDDEVIDTVSGIAISEKGNFVLPPATHDLLDYEINQVHELAKARFNQKNLRKLYRP